MRTASRAVFIGVLVFAVSARAAQVETTGVPGSPSATTTTGGRNNT